MNQSKSWSQLERPAAAIRLYCSRKRRELVSSLLTIIQQFSRLCNHVNTSFWSLRDGYILYFCIPLKTKSNNDWTRCTTDILTCHDRKLMIGERGLAIVRAGLLSLLLGHGHLSVSFCDKSKCLPYNQSIDPTSTIKV